MIKRKVRIFTRDDLFQEFLDRIDDGTTIAHYSVSNDGVHYIITEREMSDDEAKDFKMKQLRKDIAKCKAHWEKVIKDYEIAIHNYNQALNHEVANLYMQRREEAIEEYNEEQNKLMKRLEKLGEVAYTGFIR